MSGVFEVTVETEFCAAHALRGEAREIEPLHGHNFKVHVTVGGEKLDALGTLIDFRDLQRLLERELDGWRNHNLNADVKEFRADGENLCPSAENIAFVLFRNLKSHLPSRVRLDCVRVSEAPGCWAAYRHAGD